MTRSAALALFLLLVPGGGASALLAQDARASSASAVPQEPEVVEVSFRGNDEYSASELDRAILTEATTCRSFLFIFPLPLCPLTDVGFAHRRHYLDEDELPQDRLRLLVFYRQRGYRDAQVDTAVIREDHSARIVFEITENEPTIIRSFEVQGVDSLLTPKRQSELLDIGAGDRLNLAKLALGEGRLTDEIR